MQIHWAHMQEIPEAHRDKVEGRLQELAEGHSDLIDVRISGHTSNHHRHGACEVTIVCQARGKDIVASRTRPELQIALDEALEAFERELRTLRDKRSQRRPEPAGAQPPLLGIVEQVHRDRGFGFILTDAGEQVYFHRNAVQSGLDWETLEDGDRVALNVEPGEKGPQATAVVAPPPGTPGP
jgi:CspA family cold shock protein